MKKLMIFFVAFFFPLVFMITGCKKDESIIPTETLPTISLTPSHDIEVPFNGTATFSWDAKDVLSCCIVRDVNDTLSCKLSGSITLDSLITTTYITVFYVSLKGKLSEQSITITVKDGPPPPLPVPTITVSADPTEVSRDESSEITILTTHTDSVTSDMPGLKIGVSGKYPTPSLASTTTYHFKAWGKGGTDTTSITIIVNPPTNPNLDLITSHPWSETSGVRNCIGDENGFWDPLTFSQEELDIKNVFKKDGTWKSYRYGILVNWGTFVITDSTLIGYAGYNEIKVLNSITMTLKHQELSIGCPDYSGYTKRTYGPTTLKK